MSLRVSDNERIIFFLALLFLFVAFLRSRQTRRRRRHGGGGGGRWEEQLGSTSRRSAIVGFALQRDFEGACGSGGGSGSSSGGARSGRGRGSAGRRVLLSDAHQSSPRRVLLFLRALLLPLG